MKSQRHHSQETAGSKRPPSAERANRVLNAFRLGMVALVGAAAIILAQAMIHWQMPVVVTNSVSVSDPLQLSPVMKTDEARAAYGKLPLSFEANQGQTDKSVNYIARGTAYSLFLKSTEAVFVTSPQ